MTVTHTDYASAHSEQPALARKDTLIARAAGHDVAAAATDTGLVINAQAIDPERIYQARLDHLMADGTPAPAQLASWVVEAESAIDALALLIDNERRSGGLDLVDVAALEDQLTQLEAAMTSTAPETADLATTEVAAEQVPQVGTDTAERWAGIARAAAGPAVVEDIGWPGLAAGLDRADAAGWDVASNLPRLVQQDEMPDQHPARELYYRLINDCEAATPPAPSVADINGTAPAVTGEARQRADLSMQQQSHAVGRDGPGR